MTASAHADGPASSDPEAVGGLEGLGEAFRGLLAAERRLRGRDSVRQAGSLSMAHFRALAVLDEEGALPAGRIAAAAHVTPASVTQMLDHLEQEGLVRRERSAEDRRVVVVSLTDEGAARYAAKRETFRRRWEGLFGDLTPAEQDAGIRVLLRLTALLDEA